MHKHIMAALCTWPSGLPCCEGWGCHSSVSEESIFLGCGTVTGWVTPNISRGRSTITSRVMQCNKKHCRTLKMKALPSFETPRTTCPLTNPYISQHCHLHNIAFWALSKCLLPSDPPSSSCSITVYCYYRGADKSLSQPGRKQAIMTEDFDFQISYV